MQRKISMAAAFLPVGLLVFQTVAAAVDCTNATIVCNTFTKGSAKFSPALKPGQPCLASGEKITLKGNISDCTVSGVTGVTVLSGKVKGELYTNNCDCSGLALPTVPIATPPPGKQSALITTWKFAPGAACDPGQVSSTLTLTPATSTINNPGPWSPGPPFNPTALYGRFNLSGAGVGVTGIFTGGTGGTGSSTTGTTTESVLTIIGTCTTNPAGLKGFSFGQADVSLQ